MASEKAVHDGASEILTSTKHVLVHPWFGCLIEITIFWSWFIWVKLCRKMITNTTKLLVSEKAVHGRASGILNSAKHVFVRPWIGCLIEIPVFLKLIQVEFYPKMITNTPQNCKNLKKPFMPGLLGFWLPPNRCCFSTTWVNWFKICALFENLSMAWAGKKFRINVLSPEVYF